MSHKPCVKATSQFLKKPDSKAKARALHVFPSPASLRSHALKTVVCERPQTQHPAGTEECPGTAPLTTTNLLPWSPSGAVHLLSGSSACCCWVAPLSSQVSQTSHALCKQMPLLDEDRSWLMPAARANKLSDIPTGLTSRINVFVLFFKITGKA